MHEQEIWKPIPGFEGRYSASSFGRIISHRYNSEKIIKPLLHKTGYIYMSIWKQGKIKPTKVHQLIAKTFLPNPENKNYVNHKNGIKTDNRIKNLEWVTSSENFCHALKNKLVIPAKGEKCGMATLTEKEVSEIKYLLNELVPGKQIARLFGVSKFCIYAIKTGKTWQEIKAKVPSML